MFYSESILNRSVKSFLLALSLFMSGLQGSQPAMAALPGSAAGTPVIQERPQQFERAQRLPLPGLVGQVAISGTVGTLAGATAFNLLTMGSVLSFAQQAITGAGMTDFLMPKDIAYVGGGLVGLGTSAALLYKLRRLQAIAHQNAQNQNAAVQLAAGLTQAVEELQEARRGAAQALELQKTAIEALSQGQDNLEQQINLRARETVQAVANLAALQEQRFAAADQARAADTQTLQQQAATNHQATETRFTTLDEAHRLQLEEQRRTQELLKHLTDNLAPLIALAAQTQQRALAAREDAAAAAEEVQPRRPIEFQPGVVLRTQQRGRGLADILHNEVYDNDDLQ
jgi:hypothetical protein